MIPNFDELLDRYADVILKVGLNLQAGQRLLIGSAGVPTPLEAAPLVLLVTEKAYRMGARLVDVIWGDERLNLARVRYAPDGSLDEFPTWRIAASRDIIEHGDARLMLDAEDPALFDGEDPERIGRLWQVMLEQTRPLQALNPSFATNWLVAAVPTQGWAASVFPDLPPAEQVERMWQALFQICRIDRPDPAADWQEHLAQLAAQAGRLSRSQYDALRLRGPGADLTVGLPAGHIWTGGSTVNRSGIVFTPNIPTEEVFTLPHRLRIDGVVSATRPFSFGGGVIDGARFTFAGGQVVDYSAAAGEAVLRSVLESDEGARSLGEVALVPHSSPISKQGLIFNSILIDENAACHLALGRAYRASLQGGVDMSDADFAAAGGNDSRLHLDFMVGSGELDIDGLLPGGGSEAVMRRGEWA